MPETVIGRPRAAAASAGGSVMMTLGAVAFSVRTTVFQRLRRTTAYRWPALERVGRWPARQFTGPGDDKVTLDGVIMPTWRGAVGAVDALRELALTGEPQQMSAGTGEVFGLWCLEQIEEERSGLFSDGAPRRVAWALQLARYGDDVPGGLQGALARSAAAAGDTRSVLDAISRSVDAGDGPADVVDSGRAAAGGPATEAQRVVLPAAQAAAAAGGSPEQVRSAAHEAAARSASAPAPSATPAPDVAYRAAEGEMLDAIAHLRYGAPAVERLLEANPALAKERPRLPGGLLVQLPAEAQAASSAAVTLWS